MLMKIILLYYLFACRVNRALKKLWYRFRRFRVKDLNGYEFIGLSPKKR